MSRPHVQRSGADTVVLGVEAPSRKVGVNMLESVRMNVEPPGPKVGGRYPTLVKMGFEALGTKVGDLFTSLSRNECRGPRCNGWGST